MCGCVGVWVCGTFIVRRTSRARGCAAYPWSCLCLWCLCRCLCLCLCVSLCLCLSLCLSVSPLSSVRQPRIHTHSLPTHLPACMHNTHVRTRAHTHSHSLTHVRTYACARAHTHTNGTNGQHVPCSLTPSDSSWHAWRNQVHTHTHTLSLSLSLYGMPRGIRCLYRRDTPSEGCEEEGEEGGREKREGTVGGFRV